MKLKIILPALFVIILLSITGFSENDISDVEPTPENLSQPTQDINTSLSDTQKVQPQKDELGTELGKLFLEFNEQNPDTVGYIEIEDLDISHPIMYSDISNEYYLYKDYLGNDLYSGSIYLDKNSGGKWGKINLIHGHNMLNDTMFSHLTKYNNQDFFDKSSKLINIFDGEKNKTYEIFAVNIIDAEKTTVPLSYESEEDYKAWLDYSILKSRTKGGVLHNSDDILVLNTCDYSFDTARILILASNID